MSWHGPSAPRVEGIATKSFVTRKLRIERGIHRAQNSPLIVVELPSLPPLSL